MTFNILFRVIKKFNYFPEHSFRVLKKVFVSYQINFLLFVIGLIFCVFGDLDILVCSGVRVLVINPPVLVSTVGKLSN